MGIEQQPVVLLRRKCGFSLPGGPLRRVRSSKVTKAVKTLCPHGADTAPQATGNRCLWLVANQVSNFHAERAGNGVPSRESIHQRNRYTERGQTDDTCALNRPTLVPKATPV